MQNVYRVSQLFIYLLIYTQEAQAHFSITTYTSVFQGVIYEICQSYIYFNFTNRRLGWTTLLVEMF